MPQDLSGALTERIFIERSLEDFRIDSGVEQMRTPYNGAREFWRAAKYFTEQFADRRIRFQHRKSSAAAGMPVSAELYLGERGIAIPGVRERLQKQRHQFGEGFPLARSAHA